jgi:hypothetical protein
MKCKTLFLTALFTIGFRLVASANLLSLTLTNDNTGALNCNYGTWNFGGTNTYANVNIIGDQYWGPGTMLGTILTDSASDPSLRFHNIIDNGSGLDWTSYNVTVFLSQPFTITNPIVYTPGDWTINFSPSSTWNGSAYEGFINYMGGTPVSGDPENPGTLDFAYKIEFSGATAYTLSQVMAPVPEPGTAGLLTIGLILGGYIHRRMRR